MRYERFIAQRFLRSKQQMRFINIIMLVSVVGITVGVAALLVVLSVFNGFNTVVTKVLVGFDPHLRIEPVKGKSLELTPRIIGAFTSDPRIHAWAPFINGKAVLMAGDYSRVVVVRGVVDSAIHEISGVKNSIVLGAFDLSANASSTGIVLGMTLADRLGVTTGTEVLIISPVGLDAMLLQFGHPLMKKCVVTGIYDSNNKDYDSHYAFVDLETARRLFDFESGVSGVEMRLHDINESDRVKESLAAGLGGVTRLSTWYDLHRDLYSVMKIERWTAYIILCLIVGVASFNMLGSLTMGVMEKRRDIGVLKTLGATRKGIIRIFMFEGLLVGVLGTIAGMILGLAVCYVQITYHVFSLDPSVYIIPAIPVDVQVADFFAVGLASMVLSTLASLYPARQAARMLPVEAIKWE